MSEFSKVSSINDLKNLDDSEMIAGYFSGTKGEKEPGSNKSKSFWHGWRNGLVDGGYADKDDEQAELAKQFVRAQRAH